MLKKLHKVFWNTEPEQPQPVPIVPAVPVVMQPIVKSDDDGHRKPISEQQRAVMRELARRGGKASAAARKRREPADALKGAEPAEPPAPVKG